MTTLETLSWLFITVVSILGFKQIDVKYVKM